MRLFVAVELDKAVRNAAEEIARQLRVRVDPELRARWVPALNMHLTVRFIGHVADERVPDVLTALQPPMPIAPFDLRLAECGVFPPHGAPRVLWIGIGEGLPSLQALHDECNRRLAPLGFEPEHRPLNAHLTLARAKDASRGSGAIVREAIRALRVPRQHCRVLEAVVFESRLSPNGSTYHARLRVPLAL